MLFHRWGIHGKAHDFRGVEPLTRKFFAKGFSPEGPVVGPQAGAKVAGNRALQGVSPSFVCFRSAPSHR